ncbi:hypothetical protein K503DRAFT_768324 [Rhizopogon vinicolor AM-OR11-026]|uniref:Uncharacterized protein n=1 Tax=Rhizopogon vinicolor AM-OR11-026 TaxID=1314800 RepID=A0A1B7N789_9AGAM|nr:hypothetical protein K503DRAFT_768324 [Rhizopogon vinicolor AM-OR11-026]
MRLFSEIMDSDNASQGFLNSSGMDHLTSPYNIFDYSNNHPSLELLERNPSHGSAHPPRVQLHPDSGVMRASLPGRTALFVANGMDVAIDPAIRICDGQWDIPVANANPMYNQMGRAECLVNISALSTSYADPRSSTSETARPKYEIFRDGGRTKVRCHEGRCSGRRVLMKENYARHVRELHLGEKRKTRGHCRRGVCPRL